MQDQGKRLLLAVALALGVFAVWSMVAKPDEPPKPPAGDTTASGGSPAPTAPSPGLPPSVVHVGAPDAAGSPATPPSGDVIQLPFERFVATFSSSCGGLTEWQLTDPRYERDTTRGALLPVRDKLRYVDDKGKLVAPPASELAKLPACGAFEVNFVTGSTYVVPAGAVWRGEKLSPTQVRYVYADDHLELVKDFTIVPETYLVRMALKVTVRAPAGIEAHQVLALSAYAYQDPHEVVNGSSRIAARAWSSATLRDDEIITTDIVEVGKQARFEPSTEHPQAQIHWAGYDHPYLLAGYAVSGEAVTKQTWVAPGRPKGLMQTDLIFPLQTFKAGDAAISKTVIGYLGPKNYDDLQHADAAAGFQTGFNKVIDLGWFAFIGRPLLWLLQKFWEFAGNWGVSIILLTILVKILTLYWTTKSMRSMKAMAALAPQLKALQTKYGDDKQRQQIEMSALYKEHGVNPVAGCLPILLQMPVYIALYRMLANAGELYLQPFIPGWINDLTNVDPYHVLPAILFITMFLQARLQPASVDSAQQKILQYGMPIMFGVMAFFFASGLSLYMFINNVLSALHSIYMNKFDKKSLASAAQLKKNQEMVAAAAAGGAKSSGAAGQTKKPGGGATKRVIDAKATEKTAPEKAAEKATEKAERASAAAADQDDEGEESDDAPEASAASPGAGAARNRPRRKKRRR